MSNISGIEKLVGTDSLYRKQVDETKQLVSKWEKSGLLEGISTDFDKHGMAMLLENQAKQLITESSTTGTGAIGGNTGQEAWTGVALPLVRKVFGEIASKEFVSVQPMSLPSGLVFYLDFKYGTAQPGFQTSGPRGSVYGHTSGSSFDTLTENGLYGAGRFGYSINESATGLVSSSTFVTAVATWSDVNYDLNLSSSISAETIKTVQVPLTQLTTPDTNGIRAFKISGSAAAKIQAYYSAYTKLVSDDTKVQFIISGSLPASAVADSINIQYHKQGTETARGDFEHGTSDLDIPEINIEMRSIPIVAKTRKLKAVWTPEFAQDLNAFHSVDAEAELTSMLSEYISMEIDLEILDMLIQNALTTEYWSARIGEQWNSSSSAFEMDTNSNSAAAFNQGAWFQTLVTKIQKVSNKIHQRTMRGGANFLVCSPEVATILESIPGYAASTDGDKMSFAMGVQKMGAINNRFTVYKNPYMLENTILLGFRGSQFLECGAVYAPYVPLVMTPLVYDPTNFTPRKGVLTRYAKKMVRPEFYGKVIVKLTSL